MSYTREELREMPDEDLALVYTETTKKPIQSKLKRDDIVDQIIISSSTKSLEEVEKKTRKTPVRKVRSTMLQSIPSVQNSFLLDTDTQLNTTGIKQSIENLKPILSPKRTLSKKSEETIPLKTSPRRGRPRKEKETKEPEIIEPEITEPEITEPEIAEPEIAEPEITEPEITEPEIAEPEIAEPEIFPIVAEPEVIQEEYTPSESSISKSEVDEVKVVKRGRPSTKILELKPAARRGRPSKKDKQEVEEIDSISSEIQILSNSSIDNITKYSRQLKILNPQASFQKIVLDKESKTSEPLIVTQKNVASVVLPVRQDAIQTISHFLHSVPFMNLEPKPTSPKTIEDEINNITSGISKIDIEKKKPHRPRSSPKIRLLDDEIESLNKKISKLEVQDRIRRPKKSIQDIILEVSPESSLSKKSLQSSQSEKDIQSKPPSRVPSEKKTNIDVLSILKQVDKDKVSGDRGKKFYSSKEMENFLKDAGMRATGKKEELAQRLSELLKKYGL
jgi:transposase